MSSSIVIIKIARFCNCEGCREKVENTVDKLDGVELLSSDPANGKFTVSTAIHPDVIVHVLKPRFRTRQITWINFPDQLKSKHKGRQTTSPSPLPPRTTPNSSSPSISKPKVAVYVDPKELNTNTLSVDISQFITVKLNIRKHDEKQPTTSSFVDFPMPPPPLPSTIQPSAPPMPSDEDRVSAYKASSRREKRAVASPLPPPTTKPSAQLTSISTEDVVPTLTRREKRRTTSSSATSQMPPQVPPPRTTNPSDRPTSITEDVVPSLSRREKRPSSTSLAYPVPPRTTQPSARPTSTTEDVVPTLTRREKRRTTSSSVASAPPPLTTQQSAPPIHVRHQHKAPA